MSKKVVQGALFHRPLEVTSSPSPLAEVIPPPIACRPVDSQINWIRLLFSFKGRINRKMFWMSMIFWSLAVIMDVGLLYAITATNIENVNQIIGVVLVVSPILILYVLVYINMAVVIKRLHDTGRSGLVLCWYIIPFSNTIYRYNTVLEILTLLFGLYLLIGCGFIKGDPEPNKYGEPPN